MEKRRDEWEGAGLSREQPDTLGHLEKRHAHSCRLRTVITANYILKLFRKILRRDSVRRSKSSQTHLVFVQCNKWLEIDQPLCIGLR